MDLKGLDSLLAMSPLSPCQLFLVEEAGNVVFARVQTVHCCFTVTSVLAVHISEEMTSKPQALCLYHQLYLQLPDR